MEALAVMQGLTKVYGNTLAVNNLNLTIPRGKIIGLLGPNGSGKTTLIKMINGLLTPTAGSILINGMAPGPETKARIAYLPERTYLQSGMKVCDLVDFFGDFYDSFVYPILYFTYYSKKGQERFSFLPRLAILF